MKMPGALTGTPTPSWTNTLPLGGLDGCTAGKCTISHWTKKLKVIENSIEHQAFLGSRSILPLYSKIKHQRIRAMFVEIKTGSAINSLSARTLADAQTRERFGDYYDATPSIFVGLSAFGRHVAQYTLNIEENNKITPSWILASP